MLMLPFAPKLRELMPMMLLLPLRNEILQPLTAPQSKHLPLPRKPQKAPSADADDIASLAAYFEHSDWTAD